MPSTTTFDRHHHHAPSTTRNNLPRSITTIVRIGPSRRRRMTRRNIRSCLFVTMRRRMKECHNNTLVTPTITLPRLLLLLLLILFQLMLMLLLFLDSITTTNCLSRAGRVFFFPRIMIIGWMLTTPTTTTAVRPSLPCFWRMKNGDWEQRAIAAAVVVQAVAAIVQWPIVPLLPPLILLLLPQPTRIDRARRLTLLRHCPGRQCHHRIYHRPYTTVQRRVLHPYHMARPTPPPPPSIVTVPCRRVIRHHQRRRR